MAPSSETAIKPRKGEAGGKRRSPSILSMLLSESASRLLRGKQSGISMKTEQGHQITTLSVLLTVPPPQELSKGKCALAAGRWVSVLTEKSTVVISKCFLFKAGTFKL